MNNTPGQVVIFIEYLRHIGPRTAHGAVRLRFDALRPYSFHASVQWPENANYETAVRESVETVLMEHMGSLEKVAVVLESINVDPINSTEQGFRKAARAATEAAFSV